MRVQTILDDVKKTNIKKIICERFKNECSLAIKVFTAESGLNPKAVGDSGKSIGLAQINYVHWRKVTCDLFEPTCNIDLAKRIRDSSGWGAWTVYKLGIY